MKYELMNKKAVEQLSEVVSALRANRFETLSEAAIFSVAATATADGKLCGVSEISRAVRLPVSTVSRLIWTLSNRGLLEYTSDHRDRRVRLVRARFDAFR